MSVVWGMPYLLIKVAVDHVSPPIVVFGRTALAAVPLVALAAHMGALRPALRRWQPVLAFAALEMAGPWILLTHAEQSLPSGITGLLIAAVPIIGALFAFATGDRSALHPLRLAGIAVGLAGVALLVSRDLSGSVSWRPVAEVGLVCVGYAIAPFIVARNLSDTPTMGVIAVSLASVALLYAPFAAVSWPDGPTPARAWWSIVALAAVCTAVAFVCFFALINTVGPTRATVFTYVNPAVALSLGAIFLDETITATAVAGLALIVAGCALATRRASAQA